MKKTEEIRASVAALKTEIEELASIDELTDEQEARFGEAIPEFEAAKAELDAAEARDAKIEEIRAVAISEPKAVESTDPTGPVLIRGNKDPFDLSELRFTDQRSVPAELRARAHDAIEQGPAYFTDEQRQAVAEKVDADVDGGIAQFCLEHGSDEYRKAHMEYMRGGMDAVENRAALSTTGANGGFFIPFHLDPTLILTNTGTKNPFRQISRVETIAQNVWHGISSAGVTAEWTAEAAEVTDASPTFTQPSITPIRADAHVVASREVLEDSNIASQIAVLFADAKDRLEGTAFATGTGSTQPYGIITELGLVTASRTAANTNAVFSAVDIYNLVNNLPARHQENCSWVGHWFIANLIRQFAGANSANFWTDMNPGIPPLLLGRPFHTSSAILNAAGTTGLSTATASSDDILVLGDFQKYCIVDRVGMEVVYNPIVIGASALRPTGQVSWTAFWRVGARVTDASAFQMLRV